MTDPARIGDHALTAHRLRNLIRQLHLPRSEAATLLRSLAAELDGLPVDAHIHAAAEAEAEAERLRAEGFTVTTDLCIRTHAAACALGRSEKTLRNWRGCGVGPRWRGDAGIVWYSLIDLVVWRSGDVPTCPDFRR